MPRKCLSLQNESTIRLEFPSHQHPHVPCLPSIINGIACTPDSLDTSLMSSANRRTDMWPRLPYFGSLRIRCTRISSHLSPKPLDPPLTMTSELVNHTRIDTDATVTANNGSAFTSPTGNGISIQASVIKPVGTPAIPTTHPARTLVLCFDGTGDQ